MTVHVLCGGVDNDIRTVLKGSAKDRGGEGVVDDEGHLVLVSYLGEFLDIENRECGIGESLAENSLCVGLECSSYILLGSVCIYEDALDAQLLECICKEVDSTAVDCSC